MALTSQGSVDPNAVAAKQIYGDPPNGTRMNREANTAAVAAAHTTGTGAERVADGFIGEDHQWSKTAGKQAGAAINNQGSGFPGLGNEPSRG